MIIRNSLKLTQEKLKEFPIVGLLGPRQVGKTTLALSIAATCPAVYLDLENYQDLAKLSDPIAYFESLGDQLIILDEIQHKPELFMTLRSLIDKNRRSGRSAGQFLILGSASLELLRQSSESLAGRIIYLEMPGINITELPESTAEMDRLWLRGGFPDSLLATQDSTSMEWRRSFIKTYLERDIPQFGPRIPAETLKRLWTMLAHLQGSSLNAAQLATNLGISGQTVARYIDLLADLFLLRRLMPWHTNLKKRLVRSPKIYVRDSGLLHTLLTINTNDDLLSNPIIGASFEGFVIDNLMAFLPIGAECYFYRTLRGAEIDLVINHPDGRVLAIEIKRSSSPKVEKGFYEACNDVNPTHRYLVYPGKDTFPMKEGVTAIGLAALVRLTSS